jgi:predicted ArsR family transcriptional regulator
VSDELADQVVGVGALAEPARRELYLYVAAQPEPVSRERAAEGVGLPLHSVKFHLDRLVDAGLLEVEFRRLSGKTGPGAGRPSKLYRRSSRQLSVSLPERRYDLAGEVLASAIDRSLSAGTPLADAVREAAQEVGRRIAERSRNPDAGPQGSGPSRHGGGDGLQRAADVLAGHGYEPRVRQREMCLANCPFDRLAAEHTDLVCGMNLALIGSVLDRLGLRDLRAELAPQQGFCCVRVQG